MMSAGSKAGAKKRGRPFKADKASVAIETRSPAVSIVTDTGGQPKAKKARKKPVSKAPGTTRVITIIGAIAGNAKAQPLNGEATITLKPFKGLRELKAQIRDVFGKVKKKNLGKLYSVERDDKGNVKRVSDTPINHESLVDGMTLQCTYYTLDAPGSGWALANHRHRQSLPPWLGGYDD